MKSHWRVAVLQRMKVSNNIIIRCNVNSQTLVSSAQAEVGSRTSPNSSDQECRGGGRSTDHTYEASLLGAMRVFLSARPSLSTVSMQDHSICLASPSQSMVSCRWLLFFLLSACIPSFFFNLGKTMEIVHWPLLFRSKDFVQMENKIHAEEGSAYNLISDHDYKSNH